MLQLAGNVKRGGLVERAFGLTVRELVFRYGGGSATGRPVRAVQIGGPLGAYLPPAQFDTPLDYEALAARDALLGHGGVVVFDDSVDMARMARHAFEFCAIESCGKCTPCRVGSTRGVELVDRILAGAGPRADLARLRTLRHHGRRFAVRARLDDAVSGAQRARHFREDSCGALKRRADGNRTSGKAMYATGYRDLGTRLRRRRRAGRSRWRSTAMSVTVPAGTSVMRAAAMLARDIPKLCATDTLKAFGSCRLCLVQIEGRKGTPASCTTEVAPGMKVHTQSEALTRLRRNVLELYVSEHPMGSCPAQRTASSKPWRPSIGVRDSYYAPAAPRPQGGATPAIRISASSNLCIVCSRCVRACEEQQGTFALTMSAAVCSRTSRPRRTSRSSNPNVCPAAPASRPVPRARCWRSR